MRLEPPGGMDNNERADERAARAAAEHDDPMIPGAREANTLTHREAGAVSGQFSGEDVHAQPSDWLDSDTAAEHVREGGGAEGARRARSARGRNAS